MATPSLTRRRSSLGALLLAVCGVLVAIYVMPAGAETRPRPAVLQTTFFTSGPILVNWSQELAVLAISNEDSHSIGVELGLFDQFGHLVADAPVHGLHTVSFHETWTLNYNPTSTIRVHAVIRVAAPDATNLAMVRSTLSLLVDTESGWRTSELLEVFSHDP